ncbi:MAG TPA: ATP-binding protein [Micromonosporaceae bacterium]|nr:ATP-binding protein [Micromonosporaceae bacterium]
MRIAAVAGPRTGPFSDPGHPGMLLREILSPIATEIEVARDYARDVCRRYGIGTVSDAAATVATEFVTNAVMHARTLMELSFTLEPPYLYVAVRDADPRPPVPVCAEDRGFGLSLVEGFASRWGSYPAPDGKIVWAALWLPHRGGPPVAPPAPPA